MEKYQTFFPRFVALLIDSFIMIPLFVFDQWFREWEFPRLFFYFWIPLSSLVYPVYSIWMTAKFGQTLGKMAMRIKVLDVSEQTSVTIRQAVLRDLWQVFFNLGSAIINFAALFYGEESSQILSATMIYSIPGFIWMVADITTFIATAKSRALHDLIAGTVVIKTES